jgi:PAS domain-containing protein
VEARGGPRPGWRLWGSAGGRYHRSVPYFICPNCKRRSIDHDRRDGLTHQAVGCASCGFGFLFELMDDYYPGPATAFLVCDQNRRVLAAGRGVFELTGYSERELLGREVTEALGMENGSDGPSPAEVAVEWGVRQLGRQLALTTRSGVRKDVKADFFPAYDEDGGLLVALAPR